MVFCIQVNILCWWISYELLGGGSWLKFLGVPNFYLIYIKWFYEEAVIEDWPSGMSRVNVAWRCGFDSHWKRFFLIQFVKVQVKYVKSSDEGVEPAWVYYSTSFPLEQSQSNWLITSNIIYNANLGDAVAPTGLWRDPPRSSSVCHVHFVSTGDNYFSTSSVLECYHFCYKFHSGN